MEASIAITHAFSIAKARYPKLHTQWITISAVVGSRLPESLLMMSVQREGDLDLLLRTLEDELLDRINAASKSETDLIGLHFLHMLSGYWIGGMYEIFRLLRQRDLADESPLFEQLLYFLELLRMPLEKHEIAKDKNLIEPLALERSPPNDNKGDRYFYDSKNPNRAHIMPTVASSVTGSIMWNAIDIRRQTSGWIERRWLSDKMLELWGPSNSNKT